MITAASDLASIFSTLLLSTNSCLGERKMFYILVSTWTNGLHLLPSGCDTVNHGSSRYEVSCPTCLDNFALAQWAVQDLPLRCVEQESRRNFGRCCLVIRPLSSRKSTPHCIPSIANSDYLRHPQRCILLSHRQLQNQNHQ